MSTVVVKPSRALRSLSALTRLTACYPYLRLGQLLQMVVGDQDPFYWEDEKWEKEAYKHYTTERPNE